MGPAGEGLLLPLSALATSRLASSLALRTSPALILISSLVCSRVTLDTVTRQCEKLWGDKEGAVFVDGTEGAQLCIPVPTALPFRAWEALLVLSQSGTPDLPMSLTHSLLFTRGTHLPRGLWTACTNTCPVLGSAKLFVPVELLWDSRSVARTDSNSCDSQRH